MGIPTGDILEILWRTFHRDILGEQTGEFVDFSPVRKVSKMKNEPIIMRIYQTIYQFPFQDPKLEVPTIYKALISGNIPRKYGLILGTVPPF